MEAYFVIGILRSLAEGKQMCHSILSLHDMYHEDFSTVESRFKKARFKKESRFKKDCWYN